MLRALRFSSKTAACALLGVGLVALPPLGDVAADDLADRSSPELAELTPDAEEAIAEAVAVAPSLEPVLSPLTEDRLFRDSTVALQVVDLSTGQEVYAYNAEQALNPASTMKVITAATALRTLGPEYRFETTIDHDGTLGADGVLAGSLYVRGTGDPTFVHLSENAGYGGGILAGLHRLQTPVVGWCWGDGQVEPAIVVEAFLMLVDQRLDLVKARRTVREDGMQRRIVTRVYNTTMQAAFGLDTSDVNGCPKLMTQRAFDRLQLRSLDWFLDPECLLKASESGLSIGEVDAVMRARSGGASKVRGETITEFLRHLWAWRGGWRPGD